MAAGLSFREGVDERLQADAKARGLTPQAGGIIGAVSGAISAAATGAIGLTAALLGTLDQGASELGRVLASTIRQSFTGARVEPKGGPPVPVTELRRLQELTLKARRGDKEAATEAVEILITAIEAGTFRGRGLVNAMNTLKQMESISADPPERPVSVFSVQASFLALADALDDVQSLPQLLNAFAEAVVREDVILGEAADFRTILAYEDYIGGVQTLLWIVSFAFSLAAEAGSLGQLQSPMGFMLHMLDDQVSGAVKIIQRSLYTKAMGDVLEAGFRRIHRVEEASSSELMQGYQEGIIDDKALGDGLARLGFTDRAISLKRRLAARRRAEELGRIPTRTRNPSETRILEAWELAVIDTPKAVEKLGALGLSDEDVEMVLVTRSTRLSLRAAAEEEKRAAKEAAEAERAAGRGAGSEEGA